MNDNRLLIEQQYIPQVGLYLKNFHWNSTLRLARFRCPVCNDSKKNTRKTRGYIFVNKTKKTFYNIQCHNCGYHNTLLYFLKEHFSSVYEQLRLELMADRLSTRKPITPVFDESVFISKPVFSKNNISTKVSDLDKSHKAYVYCIGRKIPINQLSKILYTPDYQKYVADIVPERANNLPNDERILFELKNEKGELVGVQGRIIESESSNQLRFLTVKFDETGLKLYGREYLNTKQPVIITEGVIDSYFMPNAIALAGGDVIPDIDVVLGTVKSNIYVVLDNEPRSKDTVNRMSKAIEYGYNVYFWDVDSKLKDINKMVLNDVDIKSVYDKVLKNSLNGFKAKMKLSQWRKV